MGWPETSPNIAEAGPKKWPRRRIYDFSQEFNFDKERPESGAFRIAERGGPNLPFSVSEMMIARTMGPIKRLQKRSREGEFEMRQKFRICVD